MQKRTAIKIFLTLLYSYLLIIAVFFLFRLLFYSIENQTLSETPQPFILTIRAFLIGWRFDTLIACYVLILPWFVLTLAAFIPSALRWGRYLLFCWLAVVLAGIILIASVDIPYFSHFQSRASITILNWANSPGFVFRMIIQEPRFYLFFFVFLAVLILSLFLLKRISVNRFRKPLNSISRPSSLFLMIFVILLTGGLIFIGIRGRLAAKSPLKPAAAYFCGIPLMNQLALNPAYTFMVSYLDSRKPDNRQIELMPVQEAIENARGYLVISDSMGCSPIAREIVPPDSSRLLNVVVILMESMSMEFLGVHGNPDSLTPTLDRLSRQSRFFRNFYSAGLHTMNGVFSTLFAYPTLLHQHPMNDVIIPR